MTIHSIFDMHEKVAVVTGASSGLGVGFARTLALAGADVAIGARRLDQLDQVRVQIEALGVRCIAVPTDVARPDDCEALIASAVEELGDVDVLINNAGMARTQPAQYESLEDFQSVVAVNLVGAYSMAQSFGRHCMAAGHGGSIVNISSVLGLSGGDLPQAAYSASKAGLIGLTRDLAMQWSGRKGIRVNALAPGYFISEMTRPLLSDPERIAELVQRTPMRRLGDESELAGSLLLLASDAGSYITGTTLAVDGGWSLH